MASRSPYDLRLSVKDLAGLRATGQGTPLPFGGSRLALGQAVHDRYRARAREVNPDYQSEVFVRFETTYRDLRILVEGRADGVFATDAGWVVEEIKSVVGPDSDPDDQLSLERLEDELPDPVLEAFRWQCALYCHFLALAQPGDSFQGRLALVEARTLATQLLDVDYDPDACAAFLERRFDALLREWAEARRLAGVRRQVAEERRFPHDSLRPHQAELLDNIEGAQGSGLGLLVSAPTGIGKTAAALFPLLRGCLRADRRLMVVTAKVSQQELFLDTLEHLLRPGAEIVAVQLEAKERSCPRDEMICSVHTCPLLRRALLFEQIQAVGQALAPGGVFRAEELRLLAAREQLCPFEVSLQAAGRADVVVCDFNYAFHPQATLERFFEPGGRERVLLVDEAHNLPARAQDFLSPVILRSRVRELAEGAAHGAHPVFQSILEFLLEVDAFISEVERSVDDGPRQGLAVAEVELDTGRLAALEADAETWLLDYLAWAKSGQRRPTAFVPRKKAGSRRVMDPFINFCYDLAHFSRAAEERGDHMTSLLRRSSRETEVKIFCKDPSRHLAARYGRFQATVAMSATLEPLEFFSDVLGLSRLPGHASCSFPSPFPREHRCLVADTSFSTRFRDRQAALAPACGRMAELARQRPGNYLAFFPSYELSSAAAALLQLEPGIQVTEQRPGAGAPPVLAALAEAVFRRAEERSPSLIGCVVYGGGLSEGVDLAGELLTGAFLFGPALPAVTEERQLMQAYYDVELGAGFEYAFLYPGLSRVVQAAGRVIRGPDERGVIVLFGARFGEPRYRELLPAYWQEELTETADPTEIIRAFWGS